MASRHDNGGRIAVGRGVRVPDADGVGFSVDGTRMTERDPVWTTPAREDQLYRRAWAAPQHRILPPDMKWCSRCGDVRPLDYFRSDSTRYDGHAYICKECERPEAAERMRKVRQREAEAQGRQLRRYEFREQRGQG